jgi:hypothetical protein
VGITDLMDLNVSIAVIPDKPKTARVAEKVDAT